MSYEGVHVRLRNRWGRATLHRCVDCGERAEHWAFSYFRASMCLVDSRGQRYSNDPDDYDARCRKCHRTYDNRAQAHPGWSRLQGWNWAEDVLDLGQLDLLRALTGAGLRLVVVDGPVVDGDQAVVFKVKRAAGSEAGTVATGESEGDDTVDETD